MQRDEPLHIDSRDVPNSWNSFRRGRLVGKVDGRNETIARASGEQHFGRARRQADDALGWVGKSDPLPGVVGNGGRSKSRREHQLAGNHPPHCPPRTHADSSAIPNFPAAHRTIGVTRGEESDSAPARSNQRDSLCSGLPSSGLTGKLTRSVCVSPT